MRTVSVKLMADASNLKRGLQSATSDVKGLAREIDGANKKGSLDHVTDAAGGLGLGLLGAAGAAVKMAADFDKQMSAVSAATHASSKDMDALRRAAIQAGKDTQFSATKAAEGITELSKAGVSTADVLGGGLKGALDLAAAGQLDVGEAAETAASALTQFRLKGADVPHVADLLAAAAGKAQGSVHDMGYALNQSGLVASQFGLSIEDTTGALAEFANAGLIGSDAGTSFKTMLLAMANPSAVTKRAMAELGVEFYDAQGKFIGLGGVANELRDKLSGLTEEERNAALGQIYGSDAIRAATVLYKDGAKGVEEWKNKVNESGYAAETAAKLTDNLAGDIERLKGSLETMAIEGGSGANSGLRVITKALGAMVDQFGQLPSGIGSTITVLGLLGGALLVGGAGWMKMRRSVADTLEELRSTGPAGTRAATALETTGKYAGRAAVAFGAMQIAAASASAAFGNDLNPQLDALSLGLERFAQGGAVSGEAARILGGDLGKLDMSLKDVADTGKWSSISRGIAGVTESISGAGSIMDSSLQHSKQRIDSIDVALQQLVKGGHADQAAAIFKTIADRARDQGVSIDELKKVLPGYTGALETAGTASANTASDVKDLAGAADSASGKVMALSKDIDDLFQSQMSADKATLQLAESTNDLVEELTKGTRTLSINSDEGRKNTRAVLANLEAIEAERDARVRGGMTLDEASRKYVKDIDGMRKTMLQAGFSRKAIDELLGAYRRLPDDVKTEVKTPGLPQSSKAIKGYKGQLDALTRQIKTQVSVNGAPAAYAQLKNLLIAQQAAQKGISVSAAKAAYNKQEASSGLGGSNNRRGGGGTFHDGGWTGPGDEFDEVGSVHADEHVIKKTSRRRLEAENPGGLDYMNATGRWPGYAAGGLVMPFPVNVSGTKIPSMAQALAAVGGVAGQFGQWPSSPGAQRGDSGVWRRIVALVRASGIPFDFGNGYRPGDPLWHGSGRAVDFMGYNQTRLADFFQARQGSVLELIHRTKDRDYGITRGHYNAMPHQWPLHRNHLHVAMADGGVINEPVMGVGASGTSYSFGERGPETVIPGRPNYLTSPGGDGGGNTYVTVQLNANLAAGANPREHGRQIAEYLQTHLAGGGQIRVGGQLLLGRSG